MNAHIATSSAIKASAVAWALACLALVMLMSSLGTSIANVGLPTLTAVFNSSFQVVQWVVIAYLLAITVAIVSMGRLGDVLGRRRLLLTGLLIFMVASTFCGLAESLWLLILARVLQGLGAAAMMALTMAFVGDIVPKAKTGSAMGLLGTMSAVGTALGPSLGGLLIAGLGWRAIFLVNLPLGIVALFLAYRYLPHDPEKLYRTRFDPAGTLVLAITLVSYALAMTLGRGNFGLINLALVCLAGLGIGLFVLVETKVASPLVRMNLFSNSALSAGFASSSLVATVIMTTLVVGPFYLAGAFGLDAVGLGLVMSAGPVVSALAGIPAGTLVDKLGSHCMAILGLLGMLIGAIFLSIASSNLGLLGYVIPLVIMTSGYAIFQVANNTSVMSVATSETRGLVSGMLNLSRNLGLITGASVMGAVFIAGLGMNAADANLAALTAGMRITFMLAASLIIVALTISMLAKKYSK